MPARKNAIRTLFNDTKYAAMFLRFLADRCTDHQIAIPAVYEALRAFLVSQNSLDRSKMGNRNIAVVAARQRERGYLSATYKDPQKKRGLIAYSITTQGHELADTIQKTPRAELTSDEAIRAAIGMAETHASLFREMLEAERADATLSQQLTDAQSRKRDVRSRIEAAGVSALYDLYRSIELSVRSTP